MNNKYNYNYICINMNILNFKDFMKKYKLKNDTMNESEIQKIFNYPIYPRVLKNIFR